MPTYEYECGLCRCRFEMKQGYDEEAQAMCPQCQGRARRVFQSTPVIFKGSGFYITDSRKGKETETSQGESKASKSETGKSEAGKSESGKSNTSKSETGKSEPGKSNTGKSETSKSEKGK